MGPSLLGLFLGGITLRIPIGFALAGASMLALWWLTDFNLAVGAQRIVAGITPFGLLAIPLFVLAGGLMAAGGITKRLLSFSDAVVGGFRGGLAQTAILSSLFFGGVSGSAVADVSSLGRIIIPLMKQRQYKAAYAAAVNAASPVIAPIMPPSITMIVYGVISGTSIGDLFMAGLIPAILFTFLMMVTVHFTVQKQGFTAEAMAAAIDKKQIGKTPKEQRPKFWPELLRSSPALMLPILILVGIRGGFFTPTEAAAIAVVYALLVGVFVYREITWKNFVNGLASSGVIVGLIMLVLAAAQLYSWALTTGRVPESIANSLFSLSDNKIVILLLINILLLFAGMFIEANAALIVLTPILYPIAVGLGVDPVHLGIIIVANMGIGLITPPVGIVLMLASEIAGVSMLKGVKAIIPFLLVGLGFMALITYVPAISLWLPSIL